MRELTRLLERKLNRKGWVFTQPRQGHQKECYIAQAGDLKLFVKFGIDKFRLVRHLGELRAAPRLLSYGHLKGRPYFTQEFIEGENPAPAWFSDHLSYLASFIKGYHSDKLLSGLLSTRQKYGELVAGDVTLLETRFNRLKEESKFDLSEIEDDFAELKRDSLNLEPVNLVPVHAEPNTSNMLLEGNQLFMLDWDEIRLGDPLQDVGQILWWYVPRPHWVEFFESYGQPMTDQVLRRIFWWAARASLSIAFWQFEHGFDGRAFLLDFQAAINGQPNPRAG